MRFRSPDLHAGFSAIVATLYLLLLTPIIKIHPAQAQRAAGFAAGARSSTASNTMLDNVVGNRHSPVKSQTTATGIAYHIAHDGTIMAPNGLIVNDGCLRQGGPETRKKSRYRFSFTPPEKNFETVLIGVSTQPDKTRKATLNASFGPPDLYVIPSPCKGDDQNDRALTMGAASSLASVNGNAFALAGNRNDVNDADTARTLPDGDVQLISTPPYGPSDVRTGP
ncbi:hypothetical protein PT277_02405 [Acetobacteraceae bacterium ESL0709]|nr:hypothetical protein [Acetobacteraceae bacterium ESL0697]MDF7677554.1 hypothetical protein [Acetobacteraceae bacterium ESL0709]